MPWEVLLIESDHSPSGTAFEVVADAAFARLGGKGSISMGDAETADGYVLNFDAHDTGGGMFRLRSFSLSVAEAIFAIAEETQSFIVNTTGGAIYRTPANTDLATGDEFKAIAVASPAELETALRDGYESASAYSQQIRDLPASDPPHKPDRPSPLGRLLGGLFGKAN